MSYLVLARKWRPQTFDQVLGQDAVVRTLKNAISQNRVAHAFLFTGPRGVGKTSLARILAKALNCVNQDGATTEPCGKCSACTDITGGVAVDVLEIDGASNRGIDNIRELRETVRYLPASFRTKIYIIDEVHMLTNESFNALLKTLEEPPAHVIFIFATTEPHKVPPTILSRCQRYDFHRVGMDTLVGHLKNLLTAEGVTLPEGALRVIAREAEGGVRDSLSLLDQVLSFGAEGLLEEDILRILGVVDRALVMGIVGAVIEGDPSRALAAVFSADDAGYDLKQLTREIMRTFRNLVIVKLAKEPGRLIDASDSEIAELAELAASRSVETFERLFSLAARMEGELNRSSQPRSVLEISLVKMAITPPLTPLTELIARLEQMEKALAQPGDGRAAAPGPALAAPLFSPRAEPRPAESPATPGCGSQGATWEDFMAAVEKQDPKLFALLTHGRFAGQSGKEWRVSFPPNHWVLENLKSQANAVRIKDLLHECFGEGHRLILGEDQGLTPPANSKPNRYHQEGERRKEAMDDPVVQTLLDKLGGDIEEVKVK